MYRAKQHRRKHGSGLMPAVGEEPSSSRTSAIQRRAASREHAVHPMADALFAALESRDPKLADHGRRVARYSRVLARSLGYDEASADQLAYAASLHDIGEMALSDDLAGARQAFTAEQLKILHTMNGVRILEAAGDPLLERVAAVVLGHHERWNGAGFPRGARGDECPMDARIVAVADAYDRLKHDARRTESEVREHLRSESARAFDPAVVDALLRADGLDAKLH